MTTSIVIIIAGTRDKELLIPKMTALWVCVKCDTIHNIDESMDLGEETVYMILCQECMIIMGPHAVMDYYSELDTEEEYLEELEGDEN